MALICGYCKSSVERKWVCKCPIEILPKKKEVIKQIEMKPIKIEQPTIIEPDFETNLETIMKRHIIKVYYLYKENKTQTAKALGISAKSLYDRLETYGLHENRKRLMQ